MDDLLYQIISFIRANDFSTAHDLYSGNYSQAFDLMRNAIDVFTGITQKAADNSYSNSIKISEKIIFNTILIVFFMILVVLVGSYGITRSITKPLHSAVAFLQNVSKGNYYDESGELIHNRISGNISGRNITKGE